MIWEIVQKVLERYVSSFCSLGLPANPDCVSINRLLPYVSAVEKGSLENDDEDNDSNDWY